MPWWHHSGKTELLIWGPALPLPKNIVLFNNKWLTLVHGRVKPLFRANKKDHFSYVRRNHPTGLPLRTCGSCPTWLNVTCPGASLGPTSCKRKEHVQERPVMNYPLVPSFEENPLTTYVPLPWTAQFQASSLVQVTRSWSYLMTYF